MQINPINVYNSMSQPAAVSTSSFGRVVKIANVNRHPESKLQKNNTQDIVRILKNQSAKKYSKEESKKIKDFFVRSLGDYNGKNEIIYRETKDGHGVLVSGKEATTVLLMEMRQRKGTQKYENNADYTEEEKQIFRHKSAEYIDKFLSQRIENGRSKRPLSCFYISSSSPKGKIDNIKYVNTVNIYSAEIDGHMLNDKELKNCPYYIMQEAGVCYNSEQLDLRA